MNDFHQLMGSFSQEHRRNVLSQLPFRLASINDVPQLVKCLTNFDFIEAKVYFSGIQSIVDDIELLSQFDNEDFSTTLPRNWKRDVLKFKAVLRQLSNTLVFDYKKGWDNYAELATQLWLRLDETKSPLLRQLLERILTKRMEEKRSWLRPLQPLLKPKSISPYRTLTGHSSHVLALAISPDGTKVATGGLNDDVIIWDFSSGLRLHAETLYGHEDHLTSLLFLDNDRLVSSSIDGSIVLWDVDKGIRLFSFVAPDKDFVRQWEIVDNPDSPLVHEHHVYDMSLGNDGVLYATYQDGIVRKWNTVTKSYAGRVQIPLEVLRGFIRFIAISGDNSWLVVSGSGVLLIQHVPSGVCEKIEFEGYSSPAIAIAPDNKTLAYSHKTDVVIANLNYEDGACNAIKQNVLQGHQHDVEVLSFTPDSLYLIAGDSKGTIAAWDYHNGKPHYCYEGHPNTLRALAVTPGSEYLLSAGMDAVTKIWPLKNLPHQDTIKALKRLTAFDQGINDIGATPDGAKVITTGEQKEVVIWDVATMQRDHSFGDLQYKLDCLAIHPDGNYIFVGDRQGEIRGWHLPTKTALPMMRRCIHQVKALSVTPNGLALVSGSLERNFPYHRILRFEQKDPRDPTLLPLTLRMWPVATMLASSGRKSTDRRGCWPGFNRRKSWRSTQLEDQVKKRIENAFEATKQFTYKPIPEYQNRVEGLAISPDGQWLAAGPAIDIDFVRTKSYDGEPVCIWRIPTMEKLIELDSENVAPLAITRDSRYLLTSSRRNDDIKVFELATGNYQFSLISGAFPRDGIRVDGADNEQISISSCGRYVVASSQQKYTRLWEWSTQQLVATYTCEAPMRCCTFIGDKLTIAAGDDMGNVHFIKVENALTAV